jgi:aminobenzoyl-glutamate utilization protein B
LAAAGSNYPNFRAQIEEAIGLREKAYCDLADRIWDYAELGFEEHKSAAAQMTILESEGFTIVRGLGGMPTAFYAEKGSGSSLIGILGEYDALANMSQVAGEPVPQEEVAGAPGHGCGHNLLGTASALAAVVASEALRRQGIEGRIRYYGCPAEEGGGGKSFMARAGVFDDLDAAFTWHPHSVMATNVNTTLAFIQAAFHFTGKASHAALSPHSGRSALDAVELMNVGANYLREHMPSDQRIHYAYRDAGGRAANVVQAQAEIVYIARAATTDEVARLFSRIRNLAAGSALMTETTVKVRIESGMSNYIPNMTLSQMMHEQIVKAGDLHFAQDDFQNAERFQRTISEASTSNDARTALNEKPMPFIDQSDHAFGSTDVGDVSWIVPTAQIWTPCFAAGTTFHSWQLVAQGKLPAAHKGMLHAAKLLALSAIETICRPDLLSDARREFESKMAGRHYQCPIPDDVLPPS